METSLSHILNAEGEKLQRVLELSIEPAEMLRVNQSINATITHITHMEIVLFDKLRLAECMRDGCAMRSAGAEGGQQGNP